MPTTPPTGALLDQDTPDTIRLSVAEATALGARALHSLALPDDEVHIIVDQLIDNALCGYPFASLPRILAIAQDAKTQRPRQLVRVVHDTPVSALLDVNRASRRSVYRRNAPSASANAGASRALCWNARLSRRSMPLPHPNIRH